jgi:membrane-bound ClpP family serine protease
MLAFSVYGDWMSWTNWACLCIVIFGFILFLYGANFYDDVIGWVGVFLLFFGILSFLVLYIYSELTKKEEVQNP